VDVDVQEEFISKYRFDNAAIMDRLNVKELAKHH